MLLAGKVVEVLHYQPQYELRSISVAVWTTLRTIIILPTEPSHCPYYKEVNRMDKPLGKSSGEITIDVHLNGLDEQLARAQELVDTIKKARSLADDLAQAMKHLEAEV